MGLIIQPDGSACKGSRSGLRQLLPIVRKPPLGRSSTKSDRVDE